MKKRKYTQAELLKGMTPYTAHADLVSPNSHDWDDYFDSNESVSGNFMNDREQLYYIKEYMVPISRVKREFNKWCNKLKSGKCVVKVTRNRVPIAYLVPHQLYKYQLSKLKEILPECDFDAE